MRESWLYADENGNTLQIDLDWSDFETKSTIKAVQARLVYNGSEYFTHAFDQNAFSCGLQFGGEVSEGEKKDFASVNFKTALRDSYSSRKDICNLRVYHSAGGELNFTLVSTEEFSGTIEHDFSEKVVRDHDCWNEGSTDWYCSICGAYGKSTDRKPALGCEYDENDICARCGVENKFIFDEYYDEQTGQSYFAVVGLKDPFERSRFFRVPKQYKGRTVEAIAGDVFSNFTDLDDVRIPDTIKVIRGSAFANSYCRISLKLPETLLSISDSAFANATMHIVVSKSFMDVKIADNAFDKAFIVLYFEGPHEEWNQNYSNHFTYTYFYSEENPYLNGTAEEGVTYWHYEYGSPEVWTKETT